MTARTSRIGMGLVGPGFVGAHHIDAVRRLGFVDVVAVAGSTRRIGAPQGRCARHSQSRTAATKRWPRDPDVHVVHNTTPNYLHAPGHHGGARPSQTRDLRQAAGDDGRRGARPARCGDAGRRRPRGHLQLPRQPARAAGARDDRRRRARRAALRARQLSAGLAARADRLLVAARARQGRRQLRRRRHRHRTGAISSQHVTGRRITEVLADLTTVVSTRLKPLQATEAFSGVGHEPARAGRDPQRRPGHRAGPLRQRHEGLRHVGQVCAGHKNDLWFEVNGATASLRWRQERQNELWIGRRNAANQMLLKDPALLGSDARRYAHLPAGHQEAWSRRVPERHCATSTRGSPVSDGPGSRPSFPTFEDGYHAACLVDAILDSHRRGGVWTTVHAKPEVTTA